MKIKIPAGVKKPVHKPKIRAERFTWKEGDVVPLK